MTFEPLLRLQCLGEDPSREGLQKTPQRMAKALLAMTSGYGGTAREIGGDALFDCASRDLVLVKDIPVYSMCEHHMLPFYGKVHIAYLPQGRVLGEPRTAAQAIPTAPCSSAALCAHITQASPSLRASSASSPSASRSRRGSRRRSGRPSRSSSRPQALPSSSTARAYSLGCAGGDGIPDLPHALQTSPGTCAWRCVASRSPPQRPSLRGTLAAFAKILRCVLSSYCIRARSYEMGGALADSTTRHMWHHGSSGAPSICEL